MYNNEVRLEDELKQKQSNIRYRKIDVVDCIELACDIERLSIFKQTCRDIRALLKLCKR